jgi:hypothetical protein
MNVTRRSVAWGLTAAGLVPNIPRALAQSPMKLTLAHNTQPMSPKGMGASKFAELVSAMAWTEQSSSAATSCC